MAKCRECGREITFATAPSGRSIPLDLMRLAYEIRTVDGQPQAVRIERDVYVSHFATCTKPERFIVDAESDLTRRQTEFDFGPATEARAPSSPARA